MIDALERQKTIVREVPLGSATPTVDLTGAESASSRAFAHLLGSKAASGANLARVSEPEYGRQAEADPAKPSRIEPVIQDRLAWVLVFDDVQVPVLGPLTPTQGQASKPDYYTAQFVVIVDALTGEVLTAESI
ncbi:hypothetical protein [Nocardioides marmorisolisilvae]|uniref:Uncharacterized protein n=1 Tax=Nocardioides marmorisolisilvae TaxID=1542737 RepID=A0A3N0E066_9ACTN|nr:hypothetical protein [Nocardioides marmorisolisilvae]RNL81248.1 hypothetical protein EFL95_02450 [Nocardioides marmorisolisilvae]